MTQTIVVTRAPGDEKTITDLLHASGYRVIHEPLTSIFLQHTQRQALALSLMDEPDAVIVTSRHGVQALAFLTDLRDMFLICVGEATARAAMSVGFTRVQVAGGTVAKLVEFIRDAYDEGSRFLYASGEHIRMDIAAALGEYDMDVERVILYEAIATPQLSDTIIEHLKRGHLDAITFLSQRAAAIFAQLIASIGMEESLHRLHAFALSEAVAHTLEELPWQQIHISEDATLASMVDCVDNAFG